MLGRLLDSKPIARKVAILGAAGCIGQPLALLLKKSKYVSHLFLHDINDTYGIAADLSDIDTKAKVTGYLGIEQIKEAVQAAEIVLITAGFPRKPGMCRNDLFLSNASIVRYLTLGVAEAAPEAIIGVITNPVNSIVPVAAGVLEKAGVFDPSRLFGVTSLDCVRASKFVAEMKCLDPAEVKVPVIGGHSGKTIIPVLSQCSPCMSFTEEEAMLITEQVRDAGMKVLMAKGGRGSATLSMAHSAARFTESVCRGLQSELDVVECAYVQSDVTNAPFFATPVVLGCRGAERNLGLGQLSEYEEKQVKIAVSEINNDIKMANEFLEKEMWTLEVTASRKLAEVVNKELEECYENLEFPFDLMVYLENQEKSSEETEKKSACKTTGGKTSEKPCKSEQLDTSTSDSKFSDRSDSQLAEKTCKPLETSGYNPPKQSACEQTDTKSAEKSRKPLETSGCNPPKQSACEKTDTKSAEKTCKPLETSGCNPPKQSACEKTDTKSAEKSCKPLETSGCNPPKQSACEQTDTKSAEKGQAGFTGCNKPTDCDK